jgi:hypothetical protein
VRTWRGKTDETESEITSLHKHQWRFIQDERAQAARMGFGLNAAVKATPAGAVIGAAVGAKPTKA